MHKSKNYDMATQVAMDKLMPKPIQITISMQGGGGLTGLGDRPLSSVYGRPIPRTIYRVSGGDIGDDGSFIGGYTDEYAGVQQGSYPDIETQRVHGTSPHDIYRHGEAYGKPPGSQEQISAGDTSLDDFTGVGGQPSPEMQRRREIRRQEGLRGMMQGGFKSPQAYRDYMSNWKSEAKKSRSDAYWAQNPYGNWVTETFGGTKGTSLVLPEQAPISKNDAINNVLEDDTLSSKEKQEQIDYIFMWGPVVNRDMGRLKTASRQHRDDMKARARAQGYSPTQNKNKGGGLSSVNKPININGQPHKLAWIRPDEASVLKAMGGTGQKGPMGIPSYQDPDLGHTAPETYSYTADPDTWGAWASDEPTYTDMTLDPGARGDVVEDFTTTTTTDPEEQRGGFGYTEKDVVRMQPPTPRDDSGGDNDYQQSLTEVRDNRPRYLVPYWNALKESGLTNDQVEARLAGMGTKGLASLKEAYEKGYKGGPMGTIGGILNEQAKVYSKKLKKIIEDDEAIKGANIEEDKYGLGMPTEEDIARWEEVHGKGSMAKPPLSEKEIEEKGLTGIWENIKETVFKAIGTAPAGEEPQFTTTELIKDAVEKVGGKYEAINRDPSVMNAVVNILTPGIGHLFNAIMGGGKSIGTITRGGITYNVNEDGTTTPIVDAPSNINEGPDPEPIRRRSRGPQPVARPSTLEPEDAAPAKGTMAGLLARRGRAATRPEGLASLTRPGGVLSQVYPKEVRERFNLEDVNIA